MLKESKDTMMTSLRRARGLKLAVKVAYPAATGIKKMVPVEKMAKERQMAIWVWTKMISMRMRSLTWRSKSLSR